MTCFKFYMFFCCMFSMVKHDFFYFTLHFVYECVTLYVYSYYPIYYFPSVCFGVYLLVPQTIKPINLNNATRLCCWIKLRLLNFSFATSCLLPSLSLTSSSLLIRLLFYVSWCHGTFWHSISLLFFYFL